NGSLRGFGSSYRGSALFEAGSFKGRNQSLIYGEGGAVVRDFGFLFGGFPQTLQREINQPVNVANLLRIGDFYLRKTATNAIPPIYFVNDLAQRGLTTNELFGIRAGNPGASFASIVWLRVMPPPASQISTVRTGSSS
ncbi:MAG TPA: hypothetical protein VF614_05820, partial [Chthoniobacteraceae bacterium]